MRLPGQSVASLLLRVVAELAHTWHDLPPWQAVYCYFSLLKQGQYFDKA